MLTKAIDILYEAKQNGIDIVLQEEQLQLKLRKNKDIDKALLEVIKSNKKLIIDFLKSHNKNGHHNPVQITPFERNLIDRIPLSFNQERLWFINQLEGSVQYHIPSVMRLKGKLDKKALAFAMQSIINRHEVLRTIIKEQDGTPYQFIRDQDDWQLSVIDGAHFLDNADALKQYIEQAIYKPFDLSADSVIRAKLIQLEENEHILVLTLHHVAADGWSVSILVNELAELYSAYIKNRQAMLAPSQLQYADYALWQRQYLQGEVLDKKLSYWKEKLSGVVPLQLPTDFPRPAVQGTQGAIARFEINKEVSEGLQLLSHKHGATMFMTLLAAFKVLLYRYSGQEDICVGTPIAGRQQQEVENLIGFFINVLALRSQFSGEHTFTELLQQVKTTTLEAYEHQDVPFEKVVNAVIKERDMSRNPLFHVMLVLQNVPEIPQLRLGEVKLIQEESEHITAKFDLTFIILETPQGLNGSVEYSTSLYTEQTVQRMIGHFTQLLSALVRQPDEKIGILPMLTTAEEHQLLVDFNNTSASYPTDKGIISLFECQVTRTPDKIAVVSEEVQLSYQELDARANKLANYLLITKNISPCSNIALLSFRKIEMIVGILGILKAGCAYVPLNTEYPAERLNYIVKDAAVSCIISTDKELLQRCELSHHSHLLLQESLFSPPSSPDLTIGIDDKAYIMYTSGTTGRPKGIVVSQRSVIKLVYEPCEISVQEDDRMLQWSNYAFDGSVYEIYSSLLKGGQLFLIQDNWASNVYELSALIKKHNISVCFITTALFNAFIDINPGALKCLRKILFGGEMVSSSHVRKALAILGEDKIIHVYGPTETTVYATYYPVKNMDENGIVPIGRPLSNTQAFIVNKYGKPVPVGVPGELLLGGVGVALEYVNNAPLTAEKFIPDPYSGKAGARLYKTGDLARWLPDGNIDYVGRIDNQVKIRGYRIELGEIESILEQSGLVKQAIVIAKEDSHGNKWLVGYVVADKHFSRDVVINYLKEKLPDYMVPAQWVNLESMPLTSNGKIDKKALSDLGASQVADNEYVAPSSEAEKALAEIWQELLHLDKVGIHDNFFELGGHSLAIMQMLDRVRKLGCDLKATDLFAHQTIAQQSSFIATSLMLINASRQGKCVIPIHTGESNIPLFALPDYLIYCKLAPFMNKKQPLYAIEKSEHQSDEAAAAHYITEIRKIYPRGPYCLVGFCRWAGIALEMAHQLKAQGEEVPVLVLIEYFPPGSRLLRTSMRYINIGIRRFYKDLNENANLPAKVKFINSQLQQFRRFFSRRVIEKPDSSTVYTHAIPKPYDGKVVLFTARERFFGYEQAELEWAKRFKGEVETFIVEGDHLGIFFKEGPAQMAEKLNSIMASINKMY